MTWTTQYDPVVGVGATAGIVLIPIAVLFVLLFTTRAIFAAVVALALFIAIAVGAYHMPVSMAFLAACDGALYGAWPICLIVFAAVFLFDLCTVTGHFEVVKYTIASLTRDKRLLALLLAYCFSGFIEGASGFSTPIALASAMMIGVGFSKVEACRAALIGNTIPVVFGGIGIPITTLASVTRLPAGALAIAASRLLLPFSVITPFVVVYSVSSSVRQALAVWPACLLVGVVNTGMQLLLAQLLGPQPVSILSMIVTLAVLAAFLRVWHPTDVLQTDSMAADEVGMRTHAEVEALAHGSKCAPTEPGDAVGAVASDGAVVSSSSTTPSLEVALAQRGEGGVNGRKVEDDDKLPQRTLTVHLSMRVDVGHPLAVADAEKAAAAPPSDASVVAASAQPTRARRASESLAETHSTSLEVRSAAAAVAASRAPVLAGPGHHRILLLRRADVSADARRRLDSSSIATALVPSTVEYAHRIRPRVFGDFVRVTHEPNVPAPAPHKSPTAAASEEKAQDPSSSATPSAATLASFTPTIASAQATSLGAFAGSGATLSGVSSTGSPNGDKAQALAVPTQPPSAVVVVDGTAHAVDSIGQATQLGAHGGSDHAAEAAGLKPASVVHYDALHPPTRREMLVAWFPWMLVAVLVVLWGIPAIKGDATVRPKTGLSGGTYIVSIPGLDGQVVKPDPSTGTLHIVAATWTVDLAGATGICLFICGFITTLVFQTPPLQAISILMRTFKRMALSMLTICVLLSLGYVIKLSGMDTTLGLAAATTGRAYPFLAPLVGFLGVAVTGSATTSNVLFGSLQVVAADKIGVNHVLLAASNTCGGVLGHMLSTSSMVVAAVSTGSDSKSIGPIARTVITYAATLILAFCSWTILVVRAVTIYHKCWEWSACAAAGSSTK